MPRPQRLIAALLLALGLAGIGSRVVPPTVVAQSPGAQGAADTPTFNKDIAPIVFTNCATCHRPDGVAPMSLLTYAAAKAYAPRIKAATGTRAMPPWYADTRYGRFKNARGLTDAQIATLGRWADAGAPEGEGAAPAAPTFPSNGGWDARMSRPPDVVLDLPFGEYQLPESGEVPTFTVWMKAPVRDDRFIQALEIRPSIRSAVHHSSLALASLPQGTKIGRGSVFAGGPVLDGVPVYGDGRPFRATSGDEFGRPIFFYVPGNAFLMVPDGLGKRLRSDDYLVWGLHLISPGRPERLRVQVGVWYTRRDPHHELQTWTVNQKLVINGVDVDATGRRILPDIPPGVSNLPVVGTLRLDADVTVYSLWPHMHYRGKDMAFVLTDPNGRQTTLLSVPNYNPHWQLMYELAEPLKVKRGSMITATGHYDNSAMNLHNPDPSAIVKFGPQGTDEMYIPFIEASIDREDLRIQRLLPTP